jgi:AcrR family transcriptional regulator
MAKPTNTDWHTTFIDALHATGSVAQSARAAGVSVRTAYRHRKQNALFQAAWIEALGAEAAESESADPPPGDPPPWPPADIVEALEREAWRRAVEGYDYPVTYGGQITETYHKYSDTLLIFLLKAYCPEKYVRPGEGDDQDDGPVTFHVVYDDE